MKYQRQPRPLQRALIFRAESLEPRRLLSTVTPYRGTPMPLPGTLQAENYDIGAEGVAYHDTDAVNSGGQYRTDGVDIQVAGDATGRYAVAWTHAGEWLQYTVSVATAGQYDLTIRAADNASGAAFHIEVDGADVTGSLAVPNTGDFQNYTDIIKAGVSFTAGIHVVRLVMDANAPNGFAGNYNYIKVTPTPPPPPSVFIQAEDFNAGGEGVAYHDTEPENQGGAYRNEGVDLQYTGDTGGGYNVGWTQAGEWLQYTLTIPSTGNYTLDSRVANTDAGAAFHVEINGANVTGELAVPDTYAWQIYQDVLVRGIHLTAGTYTMRVVMDADSPNGFAGNYNWFKLTPTSETPRNLLFFGNSFTLNNDLPSLVRTIAQADGHPQPMTFVQAVPSRTLTDQLNQLATDGANNVIVSSLPAGASWDDVVYQDFSTRPLNVSYPGSDPAGFFTDAAALLAQVRAFSPGVTAIPLETWARGADNTILYPAAYPGPAAMQDDLLANYTLATADANTTYGPGSAALAKAGEAWRALNWSRDLYDGADEYHPSVKGSLLAAMMAYRSIYHERVSDISATTVASFLAAHALTAADWTQITSAADGIA